MFLGLATGSVSAFILERGVRCQTIKYCMLNLVLGEKSVEILYKYANSVTRINSWQALFNE